MAISDTNPHFSTTGGRTWAVVIVGLFVMVTIVYLGWASSYLSARLVTGDAETNRDQTREVPDSRYQLGE